VHDVDGWPLLREHMTILFADGGGLKSYLALHAGGTLAQRGVQVLYVDWELGGSDHRERLERLFGAEMPNVHYLRCDRPLVNETDRIGREVQRLSIDYWIGDSVGFGTAGPPEAAEDALAYCRAVRQIGIGSLQLAHINRSETGENKFPHILNGSGTALARLFVALLETWQQTDGSVLVPPVLQPYLKTSRLSP
jgi:hypothetical protein